MRVVRFFLQVFIFCGILGVLAYFFGGTLWLKVGSFGFLQDVERLPLYMHDIGRYTHQCQLSPQSSENSTPLAFQLRFLDDRQYVIEVVCTLIENSPIELKRGMLPPLITKVPGSAGFSFPVDQNTVTTSAIQLTSLRKQFGIMLTGDVVTSGPQIVATAGPNPKAECASYGYQCCAEGVQAGKGSLLSTLATDCPTRCYPACGSLPFVELFNSDPPFDPETHIVTMTGTTLDVIFNYNVSPKTIKNVHIAYGDGSFQDSALADGIFTHTYTCQGTCANTALLTVTDTSGNTSVETAQSKLYINKR